MKNEIIFFKEQRIGLPSCTVHWRAGYILEWNNDVIWFHEASNYSLCSINFKLGLYVRPGTRRFIQVMNNSIHFCGWYLNFCGYPLKCLSVFSRPLITRIMILFVSLRPLCVFDRVRIIKTESHVICKQIAGTNVRYEEVSRCPHFTESALTSFHCNINKPAISPHLFNVSNSQRCEPCHLYELLHTRPIWQDLIHTLLGAKSFLSVSSLLKGISWSLLVQLVSNSVWPSFCKHNGQPGKRFNRLKYQNRQWLDSKIVFI